MIGDLCFNTTTIFQNDYLPTIDTNSSANQPTKAAHFQELDDSSYLTFHHFTDIQEPTNYTLEENVFDNLYKGDVILVKTSEGNYAKMLIYEIVTDYFAEEAPLVKFVYLTNAITDTTVSILEEVILIPDDNSQYSATPDGGELVFNVSSRPAEIQLVFNEFVKSNLEPSHKYYKIGDKDSIVFMDNNSYLPYYDILGDTIINDESGIAEPGTYTITPPTSVDYYFKDMSGNQLTDLPFTQIKINYTSQ